MYVKKKQFWQTKILHKRCLTKFSKIHCTMLFSLTMNGIVGKVKRGHLAFNMCYEDTYFSSSCY